MTITIDLFEMFILIIVFFLPIVLLLVQGSQLEKANKKLKVFEAILIILRDQQTKGQPFNGKSNG
jgi:NhaP-type Na+/H+ and K+/H+ antiporter